MKDIQIYRPLLSKAWKTTWSHKRLWIFGIFAGLMNTGSMIDIIFRTFKRSASGVTLQSLVEGGSIGMTTCLRYIQKLALLSHVRVNITVTIILIGVIILALLAVSGQIALVKGIPLADRNKKLPHFIGHSWLMVEHVFLIGILFRALMIILSMIAATVLTVLATHSIGGDMLVNLAVLLIFIPLALLISYLSIFSTIEAVVRKTHIFASINAAWNVLKRHWLSMTELAILLFFVNIITTLVAIGSILLFSVPYLLILRLTTYSGSSILWLSAIIIGTIAVFVLVLAFFGFMTTYTYAAWYHAYELFGKRSIIASKIERIIKKFKVMK